MSENGSSHVEPEPRVLSPSKSVRGAVARLMAFGVGLTLALVLSAWIFGEVAHPWGWVAGLWALTAVLAAVLARGVWLRLCAIMLATALFTLGAVEGWMISQVAAGPAERFEGRYTKDYYTGHDLFGYAPTKDGQFTVRRFVDDEVVYDTVYSINAQGLRVSPIPTGNAARENVLFFGGSVTFGEGVADDQSMPYQVGKVTEGSHQVHNFGFHGYGPHQMLAALEFDVFAESTSGPVSHVIYQALPEHVARVKGLVHWDRHGPWYVQNDQGEIEYAGSFWDRRSEFVNNLQPYFDRSLLYKRILGTHRALGAADAEFLVAVVARARDLTAEKFPGSEFHVILWDRNGFILSDTILEGLARAEIAHHKISDILPNFKTDYQDYEIAENEHHPNGRAHGLIADYLVQKVLNAPIE